MPTPSGFTTREISLSSGWNIYHSLETALWRLLSPLNAIYLLFPLVPLPGFTG
ncbi:hypothetical protein ACX3RK_18555 [Escherichia coli]